MEEDETPATGAMRDPIDWAIVGVFATIGGLLLTIEQKIEARQQERSREIRERATSANRVRVRKLRTHVLTLQHLADQIPKLGEPLKHPNRPGIRGTSTNFFSDESEERYLRIMDEVGNILGRISRLCSELDLDGFPLSFSDEEEFIRNPMSDISGHTMRALNPDLSRDDRFAQLAVLLEAYIELLSNLEALLDWNISDHDLART